MTSSVGGGIRADRDRKCFERRRLAAGKGLSGQHPSDVGFDREGDDVVASVALNTDAYGFPQNCFLSRRW
jgi:hypothetical protein